MIGMALGYDEDGHVIAGLHVLVRYVDGEPQLVDFEELEAQGILASVWNPSGVSGTGSWPEWLRAEDAIQHDVALDEQGRITSVQRRGGIVRSRADITAEIESRLREGEGVADIRDLVGGPDRPLVLDPQGRRLTEPVERLP